MFTLNFRAVCAGIADAVRAKKMERRSLIILGSVLLIVFAANVRIFLQTPKEMPIIYAFLSNRAS
jgi:hypothetical protein